MRQATPDILGNIMAATLAPAPAATLVPLASIVNDGGTQMRAGLHAETITEYEEAIRTADAWPFPPVIVFHDGARYWLADGFHRLNAAHRSGKFSEIPADVRSGTRRDAILHAAGANASHGLRRTNADKRRAVEVLLRDEEWRQWSNYEIAKRCAVSESSVRNIRAELERTTQIAQSATRTGADGRTINTQNIGSNRPASAAPAASQAPAPANAMLAVWQLEATVREVLREVYGDNPEPFALKDMRTGARMRAGRFWLLCTQTLPANQFRLSDLTQAINNVADQMEQKAAASPAGDPWAMAWEERRYDKLTARCERLAEAMLPWALAWTDDKGRTWREVAERNPQHANSPFRQGVAAECQRRGLKVFEEALALTIRNVFGRLLATDGVRPLPEWAQPDAPAEAEPASVATVVEDEPEPTPEPEPAGEIRGDDVLVRLKLRLGDLIGVLRAMESEYGNATGDFTGAVQVRHGLERMLGTVRRNMGLEE